MPISRDEKNCNQSRKRKSRAECTLFVVLFLCTISILYIQRIDRRLQVIVLSDSPDIVRNSEHTAKRIEKFGWNDTSMNPSPSSFIGNNSIGNDGDLQHRIQIKSDETFLWQGAQSRLCTHIKKERKKLQKKNQTKFRLRLDLDSRCGEIHERNQHGNFMLGLYAMRVAAMSYEADLSFRCIETERYDNLFWWLQSWNTTLGTESTPRSTSTRTATPDIEGTKYLMNDLLYSPPKPTPDVACRGMGKVALHYASEYVRRDMRTMASKLLPLMESKGLEIDEVAIHLRCGDIISKNISPKDNNYGLLQFQAYRKKIPPSAKSIGIVTAPFSEEHRRKQDLGSGEMCRILVAELVGYLDSHFPNANVRVRNDPNESIPEVVSRLILSKHNFCVRSTFCLLPSIASFGISYVQKGGAAYFMDDVSKVYEDIELMDEPFLLSGEIRERGFNSTLKWLKEN